MSFILDALKKSETDRQSQNSAEFANVPVSDGEDGPPRWLWVLGALLLVNIVVVSGLLMRTDGQSAIQAPAPQPEATIAYEPAAQPAPQQQFAAEVAAARQVTLPREAPDTVEQTDVGSSPMSEPAAAAPAQTTGETTNPLALPTAQEVVANGSLTLPALHVDVHVYSESAADRFVFINMTKHKEGSVLAEGPRVQSITPEGVVLSQDGITFLLPRD